MTVDTAEAVAEAPPAPQPVPPSWLAILAEETLAAHPSLHLALSNSDDLAELVKPPVIVTDDDRAAWRAEDHALAVEVDGYRAEVVLGSAAALTRATENLWPPAPQHPGPHLKLADPPPDDDDDWAWEQRARPHQEASEADLSRWAKGKSLAADDRHADEVATRFTAAFSEDPAGDQDRAQLPEAGEDR